MAEDGLARQNLVVGVSTALTAVSGTKIALSISTLANDMRSCYCQSARVYQGDHSA